MNKDFDKWNEIKKKTEDNISVLFFHEREIWWCKLGINIGFEQDGKGENALRPVLVFKKFNNELFLGIPLSTSQKKNKYYFTLGMYDNSNQRAILSQLKSVDKKRLVSKVATISKEDFLNVKNAIKAVIGD